MALPFGITLDCIRVGESVSRGTLSSGDRIAALSELLDNIREELSLSGDIDQSPEETMWCAKTVGAIDDFLGRLERALPDDGEEDHEALADLEDWLQKFSPPCTVFTVKPGSDYGYWVDPGAIDEAIEAGKIIPIPWLGEWPADEVRERAESGILEYVVGVDATGRYSALYDTDQQTIWSV